MPDLSTKAMALPEERQEKRLLDDALEEVAGGLADSPMGTTSLYRSMGE
jgi:hypothetical protein